MTDPNSSEIVGATHEVIVKRPEEKPEIVLCSYENLSLEAATRLKNFKSRMKYWALWNYIERHKDEYDLNSPYLDTVESLIHSLSKCSLKHREELAKHDKNRRHILKVIAANEEKKEAFEIRLQEYEKNAGATSDTISRLRAKVDEFKEEIEYQRNSLNIHLEIARSHFKELADLEERLIRVKENQVCFQELALLWARKLGIGGAEARMVYSAAVNGGFYTFLSVAAWRELVDSCSLEEHNLLRTHFEKTTEGYSLKEDYAYFSVIRNADLVGSDTNSNVSFKDSKLKDMLLDRL
ncbi:MAG: hypothetical protein HQL31_13860, partial [Planctomycetes bacterium]|nr:hypothetical protein [Planctomycetota bacterium]